MGHVKGAHGLKGELFLFLKAKSADWQDQLEEVVFVKPKEDFPKNLNNHRHLVTKHRPHKEGLLVFIAGVSDRKQAEVFRGCEVWIPSQYVVAKPGETLFLGQLLGFMVKDKTLGEVGKIIDFASNGAQDLLVIQGSKENFEVPLVDDFLQEISWSEKMLLMNLPPGLVP